MRGIVEYQGKETGDIPQRRGEPGALSRSVLALEKKKGAGCLWKGHDFGETRECLVYGARFARDFRGRAR